jgi:hypothetical protein
VIMSKNVSLPCSYATFREVIGEGKSTPRRGRASCSRSNGGCVGSDSLPLKQGNPTQPNYPVGSKSSSTKKKKHKVYNKWTYAAELNTIAWYAIQITIHWLGTCVITLCLKRSTDNGL